MNTKNKKIKSRSYLKILNKLVNRFPLDIDFLYDLGNFDSDNLTFTDSVKECKNSKDELYPEEFHEELSYIRTVYALWRRELVNEYQAYKLQKIEKEKIEDDRLKEKILFWIKLRLTSKEIAEMLVCSEAYIRKSEPWINRRSILESQCLDFTIFSFDSSGNLNKSHDLPSEYIIHERSL